MPPRMPKVNNLIKRELSRLIHEKLGGELGLVTITDVETTSDLQLATVHVSVIAGQAEAALGKLQSDARYFQQILGKKLRMKFIPKLTFSINDERRHERVEQLFEELP